MSDELDEILYSELECIQKDEQVQEQEADPDVPQDTTHDWPTAADDNIKV